MPAAITDPAEFRQTEYDIHPLLLRRWSPRAMSGAPVAEDELLRLVEAARWAPSSYNNQPWRFIYALRGAAEWPHFLDLLTAGNREWAQRAGALVVIAAKTRLDRNGKPSRTYAFDTGAAWENFALQGAMQGLVVHGMEGFDYDRAREVVGLPDDHAVLAMAAVGHPGDRAHLPERLRERERPSGRKPLRAFAFAGRFPRD